MEVREGPIIMMIGESSCKIMIETIDKNGFLGNLFPKIYLKEICETRTFHSAIKKIISFNPNSKINLDVVKERISNYNKKILYYNRCVSILNDLKHIMDLNVKNLSSVSDNSDEKNILCAVIQKNKKDIFNQIKLLDSLKNEIEIISKLEFK